MLRIESLTLREIHLSLKEPFRISSGTQSRRRIVLVEMRSADGAVGWSECAAGEFPNYSSETPDTCWHAIKEWVAPRVLGRSFAGPHEIQPVLDENFRG
ncbi:MAG TPA: o-succinylbenzoate synthase, partial [Thermoanaerobaculia bacterium]|nr:o-succinylbenzoate synthase [Thermoanaerobaculia bacterium]